MLVFAEFLSKLLKSQQKWWTRKSGQKRNPWLKIIWPRFFGRIWNPFLTNRRFLKNCWGDHFLLLMCCQKTKSGHFAGHRLHSPVTGYSFVIGRSPAPIISCRLCICRSPAAFLAKLVLFQNICIFDYMKNRLPATTLKFLLKWWCRGKCKKVLKNPKTGKRWFLVKYETLGWK